MADGDGRYVLNLAEELFARPDKLPSALRVTATAEDGVIMAVEHIALPLAAVQFHPESILSFGDEVGLRLIRNVVASCRTGAG